jgi:hypothetical protein
MASTSTKSGARIRDKDKAVRGTLAGREIAESRTRSGRPSRRLDPVHITNNYYNFVGDVHFNGAMFASPPGEGLRHSRPPPPALPGMPNAQAEITERSRRRGRNFDNEVEEAEEVSEEGDSYRNDSDEAEPLETPVAPRASPTSADRVENWRDSTYGSRRDSKENHEAYRVSSINRSSNRLSAVEGSSQKKRKTKPPSVELNVEDPAVPVDTETHSIIQREPGGDNGVDEGGDDGEEEEGDEGGDDGGGVDDGGDGDDGDDDDDDSGDVGYPLLLPPSLPSWLSSS